MHELLVVLPFTRTWLPYLYLYGVGGLFFFIGMILILKMGSLDRRRKRDRFWLKILLFGYFYYAFIHLFLTYAALHW